jgi:ABC-type nitrate/sulfonate/bicarbonate transport system ATPase subunit
VVTPPEPAPASEGSSLSVRDATKVFQSADGSPVPVLDRLSLTVAAGELATLVGPSGCGKSTLLRLIAGLDAPTAGELRVGAAPITGPGAERGLVFQDPNLFPWLTVRGNIQAGPVARGALRRSRADVEEFLTLVGLEGFADAYPHQLSGGMAQRAALARVLVNHPKVLLLDEPLGSLDAFTRMRMQDEVLRLWKARGTTMLLVTHDIDEAVYMSDRIILVSPRPCHVERVLTVPLPRPRQRNSPGFLRLRAEILEMLHFAGKAWADGQRPAGIGPEADGFTAS